MRVMELPETRQPAARAAAFTLPEVVVSVFIIMLVFGAIITCYIQSAYRAEWSGFSLAAQSAAVQQLEAAKSAVWDPLQTPVMDQISQLPTVTTTVLSLPATGTNNLVYVTNYVTVALFYYGPGSAYSNYMVTVNTVWPFRWANQTVYFTNTLADYFAPE
jgi:type II secretory pathway pseudopilin PulG